MNCSAVFVQARNAFNHNGQNGRVGTKSFAFMWAALVCILISSVLYFTGGATDKKGRKDHGYAAEKEPEPSNAYDGNNGYNGNGYNAALQQEDGYEQNYLYGGEGQDTAANNKRRYN